jgi:tetratricopeptide (TPR) repeat protein
MTEHIPGLDQAAPVREASPGDETGAQPPHRKRALKRALIVLGSLVLLAALGATLYVLRARAVAGEVARARELLGTRPGKEAIASLAEKYPKNAEVQFLHARQLSLDGSDAEAQIKLARAAAFGYPEDQVVRQGWFITALANFPRARPYLEAMLAADPGDRDAAMSLALGYSQVNRPRAVALATRILERNPDDGPALCLRGRVLLETNDTQRAAQDLTRAVAQGKDTFYSFGARMLLGECMEKLNDLPAAYALYKECRAEQPENIRTLYRFGLCARDLERLDEAMEAFQEILQRRPDDVEPLLKVATLYDLKKQHPQALKILKKVEAMYPEEPQVLVQLTKIYRSMGDEERAREYETRYRKVIKNAEERQRSREPAVTPKN